MNENNYDPRSRFYADEDDVEIVKPESKEEQDETEKD